MLIIPVATSPFPHPQPLSSLKLNPAIRYLSVALNLPTSSPTTLPSPYPLRTTGSRKQFLVGRKKTRDKLALGKCILRWNKGPASCIQTLFLANNHCSLDLSCTRHVSQLNPFMMDQLETSELNCNYIFYEYLS